MTDPQVFYNKEDLWRVPTLSQAGGDVALEPYYTIMKLIVYNFPKQAMAQHKL